MRRRFISILSTALASVIFAVAGGVRAADAPTAPSTAPAVRTVALLGDKTRTRLAERLTAAAERSTPGLRFVAGSGDGAAEHLKIAAQADLVLLTVNALDGPLPITREHALIVRQMRVPEVVIAFT